MVRALPSSVTRKMRTRPDFRMNRAVTGWLWAVDELAVAKHPNGRHPVEGRDLLRCEVGEQLHRAQATELFIASHLQRVGVPPVG